ncbi:hypothetical protein IJH89_00950 [Candidatus Saccharibacteria bacterium]|nr:hypothetical protein [Candidatus Saccharibacteria bacterium]
MDSETPNNAPINPVSPTSPPEPETPLSDVETPSESLNIPVSDNSSTPADASDDTPVEAPAAQPDSPSDASAAEPASAPADPAVDSLIASAEAEAPAQSPLGAPAFSSSNLNDPATNPVVADSVVSSGKKKSKAPLLIALLLLLILGAGGAYAYFYTDLFKKPTSVAPAPPASSEESSVAETDITDEASISALFSKLFFLHNPHTTEEEFSSLEYVTYSKNSYFNFHNAYQVSGAFYNDISDFGEPEKIYIVTNYLRQNKPDLFKSLSDLNIPADFFKQEGYGDLGESVLITASESAAVPETEVEKIYSNLFGEGNVHQKPTEICGRLKYNSEYHIYYKEPFGGCGGVDLNNHQIYVEKYTETPTTAYIYTRVNTIRDDELNEAETGVAVYKTYLDHSAFYDSNTNQYLTPDPSLIYGYTSTVSNYPIQITPENFQEFSSYRFVFTKSGDNYIFKTVEKL